MAGNVKFEDGFSVPESLLKIGATSRARPLTGFAFLFRHVVRVERRHQILLGQYPVFERQWMVRQLISKQFVGMLPHTGFAYSRSERLGLFGHFITLRFLFHF